MRRLLSLLFVSLLFFESTYAQSKEISGLVTDANDGTAMAGVTVKVKGSNTATTTGTDGRFRLVVNSSNAMLLISYVGYEDQELRATDNISIQLKPGANSLKEVLVVLK